MAATKWPTLFSDPQWRYELKWDGVRTMLYCDGDRVLLRSRAGNEVTAKYPEMLGFASSKPLILDGEIVALDDSGRPSFERLQGRMNLASPHLVEEASTHIPVSYVVFDLLYDVVEIIGEPWEERRGRLDELEVPEPFVRSDVYAGDPKPVWEFVIERGMEGLVAKRLGSPYRPGARSADWRKIPAVRSLRAVVGGYTPGEGGRRQTFGSLLIGLWDGGKLRPVGSVGTGFSDQSLVAIRAALDEMATSDSPFYPVDMLPHGAVWVAPRLVAMVQFREWTRAGRLRAPSFKGFTDDPVESVTWEEEGPRARTHDS